MDAILRGAGVHREGTIFYHYVQLLAYADNIDIKQRYKANPNVLEAFTAIERESAKMGLAKGQDEIYADY